MKYYRIKKGRRSENWETGIEEYNGSSTNIDLDLTSIEDAMKIIEIANLKSWLIYTGYKNDNRSWIDYANSPILTSDDVRTFILKGGEIK